MGVQTSRVAGLTIRMNPTNLSWGLRISNTVMIATAVDIEMDGGTGGSAQVIGVGVASQPTEVARLDLSDSRINILGDSGGTGVFTGFSADVDIRNTAITASSTASALLTGVRVGSGSSVSFQSGSVSVVSGGAARGLTLQGSNEAALHLDVSNSIVRIESPDDAVGINLMQSFSADSMNVRVNHSQIYSNGVSIRSFPFVTNGFVHLGSSLISGDIEFRESTFQCFGLYDDEYNAVGCP